MRHSTENERGVVIKARVEIQLRQVSKRLRP